jgi:hypothetical protein
MTDPKTEASKLFKQQPTSTLSEYERERLAIRNNRERLKAERLAREAQRIAGMMPRNQAGLS